MDDQFSSNSTASTIPDNQQPSLPQESQVTPITSSPQPASSDQSSVAGGFNEQEAWATIQRQLAEHENTMKARVNASEGQGIIADTYERRRREIRQKLYSDFIKKSLDYHIASEMSAGSETAALQSVLKKNTLLTQQGGRDKVFRDDLVDEVEGRLDKSSSNPFQAAQEKLTALASIYAVATAAGAEQGGVTENWSKRILREARREYALSLMKNYPQKVENWAQENSDFARYLRGLVAKESLSQPEPQVSDMQQSENVTPSTSTVSTPQVSQPAQVQQDMSSYTVGSVSTQQSVPSESSVSNSNTPDQKEEQPEERDLSSMHTPTPTISSVEPSVNDVPSPLEKENTPQVQQPSVVPPMFSSLSTSLPKVTHSSTQPSQSARPGGIVIPAPTQEKEEDETSSVPVPSSSLSGGVEMTQQSPSQNNESINRPGQSFTDFLNSRKEENVASPTPSQQPQPTATMTATPGPDISSQPSSPMPTPTVPSPFSTAPEDTSHPPQGEEQSSPEAPEPEKKKGFLSKLFGR